MERVSISFKEFNVNVFDLINSGLLLTAGDFKSGSYNTMTIGWGSLGIMWGKPFIQVVVRPTRYTYGFMEKYGSFTVCALSLEKYRKELNFMGSRSGRDIDKIKETGLTVIPSHVIDAPAFDESELVIECKKIYSDDFKPEKFMADYIAKCYNNDYHRSYFGEVVSIEGIKKYCK